MSKKVTEEWIEDKAKELWRAITETELCCLSRVGIGVRKDFIRKIVEELSK